MTDGSSNSGSRGDYHFVGEALAPRGILAVIAEYRLYPQASHPGFLTDSAQAPAWTLEHAQSLGGETRSVHAFGHGKGAYNAAMLALDARWLRTQGHAPSKLAGWAGLAGPCDFFPSTNPDVRAVFRHPYYPARGQPVEHAAESTPPTFLGAARSDDVTDSRRNTPGLAATLGAAGAPVTVRL